MVSYPRRQQYRRLVRAGGAAIGSGTAMLLALALASAGAISVAAVLVVAAIASAFYARHWFGLAGRSRVGARSEAEVRRVLSALEAEGWLVRHSLRWRGHGDIDSVAVAPTGVAFAVETKTRAYDERHLARVREQAAWLWHRRRRWCRQGVVPSLCVVHARGVRRWEGGVLLVSIEWLIPTLRHAAGSDARVTPAAPNQSRLLEQLTKE